MTPQHLHPRRGDRSRDEEWIRAFLARGGAAVLALVRDGRPLCLPRLYVFDPGRNAIYLHGAHGGEVGGALEAGPGEGVPAALTVFEMGRLLPADEAGEFGLEYASVAVSGEMMVVEDPVEAEHGLRLLMEKYAPHLQAGTDYQPITPEEVARTCVLRLSIRAWSGKERSVEAAAVGAYRFEEVVGIVG